MSACKSTRERPERPSLVTVHWRIEKEMSMAMYSSELVC